MAMLDIDDLKRHRGSPVNGIHVAAGRTEAGMTAEGDKFEISAGRAGIHGAAKRGVAAMDLFFLLFSMTESTGMLDIELFLTKWSS